MLLYKNNYKDKWFILGDVEDVMYGSDGTIDSANVNLEEHAARCEHYGIPMYHGENKNFQYLCSVFMDLHITNTLHLQRAHKATEEV